VHIRGGKIGEAPLHIAARIDELKGEQCSRMLLKSGADCNLAMEDGRTPLHIAAETGTRRSLNSNPWFNKKKTVTLP
jgi:ankyrin repeat protein